MKTIYKYQLEVTDVQSIAMPVGAKILTVQAQRGAQQTLPYLWAVVDTDAPMQIRTFITYGTGHPMGPYSEPTAAYIGTYQLPGLVFHVFELIN